MTTPSQFENYIKGLQEEAKLEAARYDAARTAYKNQIDVLSRASVQANKALSILANDPTTENLEAYQDALEVKLSEQEKLRSLGEAREAASKDNAATVELRAIANIRKASKELFNVCDTPESFALIGALAYTEKNPFATQ